MADNLEKSDISIRINVDGVDETVKDLKNVGNITEEMGYRSKKASEIARLGFWGMGESAENLAQKLGVPNQAARQLGNSIEGLTANMGKGAMAVGGMAFAGMILYGIYTHLAEQKKKAAEETIKGADAAGKWIESALKEEAQTKQLTLAKQAYAKAEFDINKTLMGRGIISQSNVVDELKKSYETAFRLQKEGRVSEYMTIDALRDEVKSRKEALAQASAKLAIMKAEQKLFTEGNKDKASKNLSGVTPPTHSFANDRIEHVDYIGPLYAKMAQQEAAAAERSVAMAKARYENISVIHQAEIIAFDAVTDAKLKGAKAIDEAFEINSQREIERQILLLNHTEQVENMRMAAMQGTAQYFSQALRTMSTLGGAQARKMFEMYKVAAIAESTISTYQGASKALAQGGFWGIAMAAAVTAAGLANVAMIESQQFGSGGGGAVGTYSANSATGAPENGGYKYYSYEQSKYGSGWRPGEGPQEVKVEITVNDDAFQAKTVKAYNQSLKDGSHESRQTVRRYT